MRCFVVSSISYSILCVFLLCRLSEALLLCVLYFWGVISVCLPLVATLSCIWRVSSRRSNRCVSYYVICGKGDALYGDDFALWRVFLVSAVSPPYEALVVAMSFSWHHFWSVIDLLMYSERGVRC